MKFLFFLIIAVASPALANTPNIPLHQKCIYPTVLIGDQEGSYGSGVIVRSEKQGDTYTNMAITCDHVTSDMRSVQICIAKYNNWSEVDEGKSFVVKGIVESHNEKSDLSIVFFNTIDKLPTANIGLNDRLYIGDDIIGVGCALHDFPRIDYGKITGISKDVIRANVFTVPGDSGGPIFHNYKLVGFKQRILTMKKDGQVYPLFHFSNHIPVALLKTLKYNGQNASFIYDKKASLPLLPTLKLEASNFSEVSVQDLLQDLNISDELDPE